MEIVKADSVSVKFRRGLFKKKLHALDDFSLSVEEGDVFALLGPNGAGKSTAMYSFLGLIRPDEGRISVLGREPVPGSELFREVAYLPEEPHYHLYLTVEVAVTYYASLYGTPVKKRAVDEAIEKVGLTEFRDLRLSKCSKGMKQKMGIAQCLMNTPRLVFLDEPTRGLDPVAVKELRDMLLEMNRRGATIIMNSHVLSEIEMVCNRVAIINKGRVAAQDELHRFVGFDLETYAVEFDHGDDIPGYVTVTVKTPTTIRGEIPKERLMEFVSFADGAGLRVYGCTLKKTTLEDAFFDVLKGGETDAPPTLD
ncbi:MAG: ABC transporter ATP-binding protein [Thermodesulfobacteriota bacterium]